MNAAYINPFIQGAQSVFNTLCKEAPSLGKLFVKSAPYTPSQVSIALNIIGEIHGEVVYNMTELDGYYVASLMMFGMPVTAFDDMTKSAVSELANMISGHVATIFAGKGIKVDITPPNFHLDAAPGVFKAVSKAEKVVCVPLHFNAGPILHVDIVFS